MKIPVSADIESGYGEDAKTIVENVLKTADLGVAGINIEDSLKKQKGLRDLDKHCDVLSKIRTALDINGYKDFYINARIDTFLQKQDPLVETIDRAKAYVESGASGKGLGVKRFSFGNSFSDKVVAFIENSAAHIYESKNASLLYE